MSLKNTRQNPVLRIQPTLFWPLVLATMVFIAFWPIVNHGFFNLDDIPLITRNRVLMKQALWDLQGLFAYQLWSPYYKPLVYLTWMIERDLFGLLPSVLHFNNMVLHAINAILVFILFSRILPCLWPSGNAFRYQVAGFSALIWALHPFRVESVAWAVERKDVLFVFFYLLACLAWITQPQGTRSLKMVILACICFALSCLSKSMGITFPAIALLLDHFVRTPARQMWLHQIPLVVLMMAMLFIYGYGSSIGNVQHMVDPLRAASAVPSEFTGIPTIVQHALIANYRLCLFILHTLIPVQLAVVYPREVLLDIIGPVIYALPLLTGLLILIAIKKKWRRSVFALAFAWFFVTISPILSGEGVGTNFLSDRYTYLPSMALILAIVIGIYAFSQRMFRSPDLSKPVLRNALVILSIISLIGFISTRMQVSVWRSGIALWEQAIDHYPKNWYALYNRAKLSSLENPQGAIDDLNLALVHMKGLPELFFARGTLFMEQGNIREAIVDFDQVLEKDPEHIEARINRGNCYRTLKQHQNAITDYNTVLSQKPKMIKAINNRGLAYLDLSQVANAERDFTTAITLDAGYAYALLNRGNLRLRPEVMNYDGAIHDFTAYLKLIPQSHEALFRRGYALLRVGRAAEALNDMNEAIRLHGNEGFYYVGRSQVHGALGNEIQAKNDLKQARSLGVDTSN